jgi:4-aminobutyrate--pyruvate transaminase
VTPHFAARLDRLKDHPLVGEVRSCGLMAGVELVADKATKRPFDPAKTVGAGTARMTEKHGAILRAIGDTIALCPPMIITAAEIDLIFDRFEKALDEAEAWVTKEKLREA